MRLLLIRDSRVVRRSKFFLIRAEPFLIRSSEALFFQGQE
jgi:hypothetical protein